MSTRVLEAGGAPLASVVEGGGPVLAFALHAGHAVRPKLAASFALSADERLREEDPATAEMAPEGRPLVAVLRSRFEVDLNRPRFRCVYQGPEDAWGLHVWRGEVPDAEDRVSRAVYDTFYSAAFDVISRAVERHGRVVVLDLHSYNHRRDGVGAPAADPAENPEVNLGTGRLDRTAWAGEVGAFVSAMTDEGFDVRENVKFRGGHFAHWVAETFPRSACALAIEFKKTYMDEWSGVVNDAEVTRIRSAVTSAADSIERALEGAR